MVCVAAVLVVSDRGCGVSITICEIQVREKGVSPDQAKTKIQCPLYLTAQRIMHIYLPKGIPALTRADEASKCHYPSTRQHAVALCTFCGKRRGKKWASRCRCCWFGHQTSRNRGKDCKDKCVIGRLTKHGKVRVIVDALEGGVAYLSMSCPQDNILPLRCLGSCHQEVLLVQYFSVP